MNVRLYLWQRGTAAVMLPMIFVHLVVIFYAMNHQLTASEILSRTQGSIAWGLFYGSFVVLASIHASIGVGNILREWAGLKARASEFAASALGLTLLVLGLRAVAAVVLP
ncbi:MAG TPA: succinate dehydrogenase [Acidocella sp.]|nr:MAG: succinate dehydrogenase [Acidocella sp. 20-58-15]HQT38798.1 succinate dehydrogenase [Acidocella sp.]